MVNKFPNTFECNLCSLGFQTRIDLKSHSRAQHLELSRKEVHTNRFSSLESRVYKQKFILFSKLLELKEKEEQIKQICKCKGSSCKIHHKIYNWRKTESDEFVKRSRSILGEEFKLEAEPEIFKCESCVNIFKSLEDLENHSKSLHSREILQACSDNPWGLNFFDY